jgi:hypothetical protein
VFLLLRLLAPLHSISMHCDYRSGPEKYNDSGPGCTALGFWDTGLNPKLRLRRVEAAAVGIALAR